MLNNLHGGELVTETNIGRGDAHRRGYQVVAVTVGILVRLDPADECTRDIGIVLVNFIRIEVLCINSPFSQYLLVIRCYRATKQQSNRVAD